MADVCVAELFVFFDVVPVEAAGAAADRGFADGWAVQVAWTGHPENATKTCKTESNWLGRVFASVWPVVGELNGFVGNLNCVARNGETPPFTK